MCDQTLTCGHPCSGVKGEEECLPCLHGCAALEANLKQDADDMCMICYTEGLSCAPCIQVGLDLTSGACRCSCVCIDVQVSIHNMYIHVHGCMYKHILQMLPVSKGGLVSKVKRE